MLAGERHILLGTIVGAHGVRGEVRIKSFTAEPRRIAAYGPLADDGGRRTFKLKVRSVLRGLVIAAIDGVGDRDAAEALRGVRLYVSRARLPKTRGEEWYAADLVGLAVETVDGQALGQVRAVDNFGAGDVLEIGSSDRDSVWLPFTRMVVPTIDLAGGRVIVDPPREIEARPDAESVARRGRARRSA